MSRDGELTDKRRRSAAADAFWPFVSLFIGWSAGVILLIPRLAERQHFFRDAVLLAFLALAPVFAPKHFRVGDRPSTSP